MNNELSILIICDLCKVVWVKLPQLSGRCALRAHYYNCQITLESIEARSLMPVLAIHPRNSLVIAIIRLYTPLAPSRCKSSKIALEAHTPVAPKARALKASKPESIEQSAKIAILFSTVFRQIHVENPVEYVDFSENQRKFIIKLVFLPIDAMERTVFYPTFTGS